MAKNKKEITCQKCGKVAQYLGRTDRIKDKKQIFVCTCGHSEPLIRFIQQTGYERMFKDFKKLKPDTERPQDLADIVGMILDLSDEDNEAYFENH